MYPDEAYKILQSFLDYEGQSGRLDDDVVEAIEVLIEIGKDYYVASSTDSGELSPDNREWDQ